MDNVITRTAAARYGPNVVGVDEVGRGAWAGPLTFAALRPGVGPCPEGVDDSKKVSTKKRPTISEHVHSWAADVGFGHVGADRIDRIGMSAALREALCEALDNLDTTPDVVLLDGTVNMLTGTRWEHIPVQLGAGLDGTDSTVAAASIVAKVCRDTHMSQLGALWPMYCFEQNKGYPSPTHRRALELHGPSPQHRISWKWAEQLAGPWRDETWTAGRRTNGGQFTLFETP